MLFIHFQTKSHLQDTFLQEKVFFRNFFRKMPNMGIWRHISRDLLVRSKNAHDFFVGTFRRLLCQNFKSIGVVFHEKVTLGYYYWLTVPSVFGECTLKATVTLTLNKGIQCRVIEEFVTYFPSPLDAKPICRNP